MFIQAGKILICVGIWLIVLGLVFIVIHKIPYLGKLPGDFLIKNKNFIFYFPLSTSILVSIIISLILWLIFYKK